MKRLPEELLTAGDVAKILRLSKKAIYEKCLRGELPCVKIGRNVRFLPSAISKFVEECSRGVA